MVLISVVAVLWFAAVLVVVGLCMAAARGDAQQVVDQQRPRLRTRLRLTASA